MCRVRFGLTGIYLDALEPSRPREEFFQPLVAAIPPVAQNKQGNIVLEAIDEGPIERKVVNVTELATNVGTGAVESPIDSSKSRDDQGCRSAKKAKTKHALVGSKRVRETSSSPSSSPSLASVSSSSPSSSLSAGASSQSFSEEDRFSTNSGVNFHASELPNPGKSLTTQKFNNTPSKRHSSKLQGGPIKAPSAKRVRFAMNVQEKIIPSNDRSDTSSSHSSDDSYTDPPSPTEPYDAFAGYHRTPRAPRSHRMNGRVAESKIRLPAAEESETDEFLDSEDGSEIDVQNLLVKRCLPKTARGAGKGQNSDQRPNQSISTPLARSEPSGRVMNQSRVMADGLESNVDGGLSLEQPHMSRQKPVSHLQSGGQLRYPKLRSGKDLPEPIFVARPKFLSDAKGKGKFADRSTSSGHGQSFPKCRRYGTKTPPLPPTRFKASTKMQTPKYHPPSVSDDLKRDAEFDESLGILIRDV